LKPVGFAAGSNRMATSQASSIVSTMHDGGIRGFLSLNPLSNLSWM